jgi:hypothetical protein
LAGTTLHFMAFVFLSCPLFALAVVALAKDVAL